MLRSRMSNFSFASTTMLRPSGVSSASDESCAASARSARSRPAPGGTSVAWRLPSVIVPVLSRRSTSTSPAASTARPDVAMTFAWIMRSMPAMPIAESRPPIVVGMRHTRSATSTVIVTGVPCPAAFTLKSENGSSVTVARRKMIVSAASRMSSAISFGVFCRLAPSTIAIMRSRNVSPGIGGRRGRRSSRRARACPRRRRCDRRRSRG